MPVQGESEFLNLPFADKLEFLYGLPARRKRDLIMSAPEAEHLVKSFSPETLFYTLKEIGSADCGDLLAMAAPEQVQGLFDLDCWNKDRVDFGRLREWIATMAEGGRGRMAEALMEVDLELMTLLLRRYLLVHRLDEIQTMLDVPNKVVQFDEQYAVEFIRDDSLVAHLQEFLEEAFERDYDYFSNLLDEVYWSVDAELEEQAYQYRRARLNDRGFPDFFEAQSVFAYLAPDKFEALRRTYIAPNREPATAEQGHLDFAMVVPGAGDGSLLNTALTAGFAAQGQRQIRTEMALVANQVLVARSIDFGDAEAVRSAIEFTHHYLNLALEHLASGELKIAIDYLRTTHLKLLFRLGISLTIDLRKRAESLRAALGLAAGRTTNVSFLDSPYAEALAGFLQRAPRFFGGLETAGEVTMRDFKSMRDLHLAYRTLEQLESLPALFSQLLSIDLAGPAFRAQIAGHDIRLSQIVLTSLVNRAMGNPCAPDPIPLSRLPQARSAVMTKERPARLKPGFRDLVSQTLNERLEESLAKRSEPYLRSCTSLLEEEFAELAPEATIDPRFIRGLLLRRD